MSRSIAMAGTLYGVGVGPGDPELLTLKAARILGQTRVVAFFTKRKAGSDTSPNGNAFAAAAPHLAADRLELAMVYPVTTEHPVGDPRYDDPMTAFYEDEAARISAQLDAGNDVAVLAEGDPFFYGSFMHLFHRLAARYRTVVVPGVTGMSACWTASGHPISYGDDVLTIIPATLPEDIIRARLAETDAAVFMKIGRHFAKVRGAVAACGMLSRALYVERGSTADERVLPLGEVGDSPAPYFAIVLVPGQGRRL